VREGVRLSRLLHEPLPDAVEDEYVRKLAEPGGLDPAELLEVCQSAVFISCGFLFDNRDQGLNVYGNTVLLVVHQVSHLSSELPRVPSDRRKWDVANSEVRARPDGVDVSLTLYPGGSCAASGTRVSLYDLEVEGLEQPADYMDPEDEVVANMATWASKAHIRGIARLGPSVRGYLTVLK